MAILPWCGGILLRQWQDPWRVQKRFMGGAKKSMARARKNFAKKQKREARARVLAKRPVNPSLDKELKRDTKLRMVWNVKLILAARNGRVIPNIEFGRLSRDLGFPRPAMFPKFVGCYPGIFRITQDKEESHVRWLEFSEQADLLVDEEQKIMREYHEPLIVHNIRKLLMMVPERRISMTKIAHIRSSFWMPDDFKNSILPNYPQYFSITGGYLELTNYDASLAVSYRERNRKKLRFAHGKRDKTGESGQYAFKISLDRNKPLDGNTTARLLTFQRLPFPGPYDSIEDLDQRSIEAQKRAVGICHEFLSFTVEKRSFIDNIVQFKNELRLPEKLEDMLARYPHIFYVCMRGDRHVVFLKECFLNGQLKDTHPLIEIRRKFTKLMDYTSTDRVPRHPVEFRGICAENFVSQRHPSSTPRPWSFPLHSQDTAPVQVGPTSTAISQEVTTNTPLKRSTTTMREESGGLILQLGLSEDEEESPKKEYSIANVGKENQSLAIKLGIFSQGEDSDEERKPRRVKNELMGWDEKEYEDVAAKLERKKKKHNKKPFWEKRPFDTFDDPFF